MLNTKIIGIVFTIVILVLLLLFTQLRQEATSLSTMKVLDQLSLILRTELDKEKSSALRYALLLSRNDALIEAMADDDEEKGYLILSELMQSIKQYTHAVIRTQIITDDYLIFARSWDNSFAGMPIDEYRPDLQYFQNNKKPRSAIEVGRRLGIKATVPIYKGRQLLGFVEVLQFFESITESLQRMGVDLYILMDERFFNIAILMQNNPFIGKYVIANRHYNTANIPDLQKVDFEQLRQQYYFKSNKKYLFFEPMKNGAGEDIGAFVFVMPEKRLKLFASKDDELSFLINFTRSELYDIVKQQHRQKDSYKSNYDKELLYLKDVVDSEDRELFIEEAHERLDQYTKEELIGLMLNYNVSHKVEGEIR